jgi:hypothetical protein
MSYNPNNLCVYVAAVAGYNAGLIAGRNQPTDPNENDYTDGAERADAFGQAVDTVWGIASYTNADLQQIENAATAMLASGRSIVPGLVGLTAAGYTGIATALVAGVQAGTRQIVAEGVNPNGCGGGGGGTVTSVTGSAPIVITGSAASPNVTITAATDSAAGSMSAADKTKLDSSGESTAFGTGTGAATSQSLTTSVTVGPSGKLLFVAQVTISNSGGTAVNGDVMELQATLDGTPIAGLASQQALEAGVANITVIGSQGGLTPGATHVIGILATDSTNGAHTFVFASPTTATFIYWTP